MKRALSWACALCAVALVAAGLSYYMRLSPADAVRKDAEKGDVKAQYNLGDIYFSGRDTPKDDAQAAQWYRKAAAQGFTPAKDHLEKLAKVQRP